ncbi:MAG: hypothetical protein GY861_25765 [bacterium]|nr:hypothetical protein [bacterium]
MKLRINKLTGHCAWNEVPKSSNTKGDEMKKETVQIDVVKLMMGLLLLVLLTHTGIDYGRKIKGYYINVGQTMAKTRRINKGIWRTNAQSDGYKYKLKQWVEYKGKVKNHPFKTLYASLAGE